MLFRSASVDAYEAFQIGVYYGNLRTRADMEKAVEYFQKAIDIDPRYARAYGMQADTYNMLGYYGFADRREMLKKAEEAVDKALALDDQLAEGYIARSFINLHLKDGGVPARSRSPNSSHPYRTRAVELKGASSMAF